MSSNTHNFNDDELEAPKWLNNEFILKVLRNCEKVDEIEVLDVKFSPATAKGDHYASVMYRAAVHYLLNGDKKQKSLIIKIMPEIEGNKKEMFEESYIFETEIGMYLEVIPRMESILRAAGDKTVMGPPCLYHTLSPKKMIIFEDIVPRGYTVIRNREITLEEAKAIYEKIAKWHAVSYKLNLEDSKFFDQYCHSIFSTKSLRDSEAFQDGITNFIAMLEENEDLREYIPYFKPLVDNILDSCVETFEEYRKNPQDSAYYVLCHGDFHSRNLMLKHNSVTEKFEDVLLLDYQFSYIGPIINDILYSKFMLLTSEQRVNNWDELLFFYFSTFQETLKKLEFKGEMPTMIEFRKQLMRHKHLELFLLTTFLPIWIIMSEGIIGPDELITSKDTRVNGFKRSSYVNEVRKQLPKYLYAGYLE